MPEKGWYSLTVRKITADKVRELAKIEDLTVDKYLNQLIDNEQLNTTSNHTVLQNSLVKCKKCGVMVKGENMEKHMGKHAKEVKKKRRKRR
jgi:hypothetical protein